MAERNLAVELGNVICRFGDDAVLLDHFDEIVLPAFVDDYVRSFGDTKYFFEKVSLVYLGEDGANPVVGITGRFIKDHILSRDQVYIEGKGLVHDREEMQSSPSALFLLILNNHRLVYLKETGDAPPLSAFRSTLLSFLRQQHGKVLKLHLDAIPDGIGRDKKRIAREEIHEAYQKPTLLLIPLTSDESIEKFIGRYETLKKITITFAETNDETHLDDFFASLQDQKESLGSDRSSVVHAAAQGLDKAEAIAQVSAATEQGTQSVTLRGVDDGGDLLIGNNEQFQIRKAIDDVSEDPEEAATDLYEVFTDLVNAGSVKVKKIKSETIQKIKKIMKGYFDG